MALMSEIDVSDAAKKILLYGAPKTGKTKLALMLAEAGYTIHLIDLENGFKVGKQLSQAAQSRIDVITLPDTKEHPCAMQALSHLFSGGKFAPCVLHGVHNCMACIAAQQPKNSLNLADMGPMDVVVIDSLTQWSNSIMAHIGKNQKDDWNPEWEHFRRQGTVLDMCLGSIQNSFANWIVISHEIMAKTQTKEEKIVPIAGTRNFSRNTAKYFDTVVYCEIVNGKHTFNNRSTYKNLVLTGDRMDVDMSAAPEKGLLAVFEGDRSKNRTGGNPGVSGPIGGKPPGL